MTFLGFRFSVIRTNGVTKWGTFLFLRPERCVQSIVYSESAIFSPITCAHFSNIEISTQNSAIFSPISCAHFSNIEISTQNSRTMSNSYTEAVILSNQGVAMIEAGNYPSARATFKKALRLIKTIAVGGRKRQLCGESSVAFRWSSNSPLPAERQGESLSGSFVYRRALLIIPSDFSGTHNCYTETAAMLYNLSLSFHIEGNLSNNSTLLNKALKAYKIALTLRKRRKVCRKLQGDRLLDVAINNNMAMIHQEFMEFERARTCFVSVSRALRSLGNSGFLEQTEYQGLVLNLMMGRHEITLAAAA